MTVKPVLWIHKPRKDGSCLIRFYIYNEGVQTYKSTELHVMPEEWDSRKEAVKPNNPLCKPMNARIAKMRLRIQQEKLGVNSSLIGFIEKYIEECKSGVVSVSPATVLSYKSHLNKLRAYSVEYGIEDLSFMDIDMAFYGQFCDYLARQGCTTPGMDNHIKRLKKFMRDGLERGLHENKIYASREFKRKRSRKTDKVYLTREEIDQIAEIDLRKSPAGYSQERDRWLIGYYLLLRYTDTLKIRRDQFFELEGKRFHRNNAQKTAQTNYVPVSARAWSILERNDFSFSGANQVANRYIKDIARLAGIDAPVGGQPKYELISTHTARRSMATQLHQSGMDIRTIMQLGGWKSEEAIKAYLLSSDIQLAKQAAENELFQ